jgi:hypothetical protein
MYRLEYFGLNQSLFEKENMIKLEDNYENETMLEN